MEAPELEPRRDVAHRAIMQHRKVLRNAAFCHTSQPMKAQHQSEKHGFTEHGTLRGAVCRSVEEAGGLCSHIAALHIPAYLGPA